MRLPCSPKTLRRNGLRKTSACFLTAVLSKMTIRSGCGRGARKTDVTGPPMGRRFRCRPVPSEASTRRFRICFCFLWSPGCCMNGVRKRMLEKSRIGANKFRRGPEPDFCGISAVIFLRQFYTGVVSVPSAGILSFSRCSSAR